MIATEITHNPNADVTAGEIRSLFELYGSEDYDGEPVSQTSHMLQAAMQGVKEGSDEALILGGFLHDIGHLLRHKRNTEAMGAFGVVNHEGIGADYLKQKGFSEKICAVVGKHVDAKRFLVATDPEYKSKLSLASLETLKWQGGPMNEAEVEAFKNHPYFHDIITVRLWDEKAKDIQAETLPLEHFITLVKKHLAEIS